MTPLEKWLITCTSNKRLLSDLYKLLQTDGPPGKSMGQLCWEKELGWELTSEEWEAIYTRACKTTPW